MTNFVPILDLSVEQGSFVFLLPLILRRDRVHGILAVGAIIRFSKFTFWHIDESSFSGIAKSMLALSRNASFDSRADAGGFIKFQISKLLYHSRK